MSSEVEGRKSALIQNLNESRAQSRSRLEGADFEQVIYAESGWRVKDLIAHVAAWENQVGISLEAYNAGQEYSIPGFTTDHAYNEVIFQRNRDLPIEQIEADWASSRERLLAGIRAIPEERFGGQIMCPWKKYSGIDGIVRDMINHEAEHIHDIVAKAD